MKAKMFEKRTVLITLAYAVAVTALACFHEVWRDEVIPLSLVSDSTSPADLFANIHNFGHPGLWYYLLYLGYGLYPKFVILKIVNLVIAIAAVYVFLSRAPFSQLQKILFIGGLFPLYIYPVINRDYGLSMLVIFLFCILYPKRFERMVALGIVLFLLANTVAYTLIMTGAIAAALALEFLCSGESRRKWMARPADTAVGAGLMLLGMAASVATLWPDYTVNVVHTALSFSTLGSAFVQAVLSPEKAFPTVFGFDNAIFLRLAAWVLAIYLWGRNRYVFVIFAVSLTGLGVFFHLGFPTTALRHQGAFYLLLILTLWLDRAVPADHPYGLKPLESLRLLAARCLEPAIIFILVLQVCAAYPEIKKDLRGEFSSCRRFAAFLKDDPKLKNAVVVGEPGTYLEALPYYADNPIFMAREGKFGKCTGYTIESRGWFSLDELLATVKKLKAQTGRPVVIVMGHRLSPDGPFVVPFSAMTRKVFTYTPESLHNFQDQTVKLAGFHPAITDEEYDVYLLK